MVTDGKKWLYLAVKCLSALFRGITLNNNGEFYCLHCFRSYIAEKNFKNMKNYVMIMIIVTQKCRNEKN